MMSPNSIDLVIHGCAIACVDDTGTEHATGYITVTDGRITAVAAGTPPSHVTDAAARVVDGSGMLATPGLVNCHHHLFQWLTRGHAADATLFEWLTELYPTWQYINDDGVHAAATAGLAALALSGCTLSTDHHYLFPAGSGDLLEASIKAAERVGIRFHPTRGSMDLGQSQGGLPPDSVTETHDQVMAASEAAITRWHDPSDDAMVQIAIAPCSPFSVTRELMVDAAALARRHGVRLHTHLAETLDEEVFCIEQYGIRPVEYLEQLDWLGPDVWLAHCIHLSDDEVATFGRTGTGVSHCPSSNARLGAGIAPVVALDAAGAPVGLGVDGAASNEAGELSIEVREALLFARLAGGPTAMTARDALRHGTMNGAKCLGRDGVLGTLEVGALADIVLWDLSGLVHDNIIDPVTALVFGPPQRAAHVFVAGKPIVTDGQLTHLDEDNVTRDLARETRRLADRVAAGAPVAQEARS